MITRAMGVSVLIVTASLCLGHALASGATVPVEVTILSCSSTEVPKLSIGPAMNHKISLPLVPKWSHAANVWRSQLDVPEGYYYVSVWPKAAQSHCINRDLYWAALPGAVRHILITLNSKDAIALQDSYRGAIYGYIPLGTSAVEIIEADSALGGQTRRPARIDGNTYQINDLTPGQYVVVVLFDEVRVMRVVTVPLAVQVRADLTTADAATLTRQQAAAGAFRPIGHVEEYFEGAASADGWLTPVVPPANYSAFELRISPRAMMAVEMARSFLNSDSALPAPWRVLGAWSITVAEMHFGSRTPLRVDLVPLDMRAWDRITHQSTDCDLEEHGVMLSIDVASKATMLLGDCP